MSFDEFLTSWRDPQYVGTVVGVLACGAVVFYTALIDGPPTPEMVVSVMLAILIPAVVAHEVARRLR